MSTPIHIALVRCDTFKQFNTCIIAYLRDNITFEANANTLIIYLQGY